MCPKEWNLRRKPCLCQAVRRSANRRHFERGKLGGKKLMNVTFARKQDDQHPAMD